MRSSFAGLSNSNIQGYIVIRSSAGAKDGNAILCSTGASDHNAFGMLMPGRNYNTSSARYGFNGKENDNDIITNGRWQDYGFREYRPDLCRFISVDPLTADYPWYTPYQFSGNTPIQAVDLDGLEESHYMIHVKQVNGKPKLDKIDVKKLPGPQSSHYHAVITDKNGKTSYYVLTKSQYSFLLLKLVPPKKERTFWDDVYERMAENERRKGTFPESNSWIDDVDKGSKDLGKFSDDPLEDGGGTKNQKQTVFDEEGWTINKDGTKSKSFEEGNIFKDGKGDTSATWDEVNKTTKYEDMSKDQKDKTKTWKEKPKKSQ